MFPKLSKGLDTDIAQRVIEPSREGKCPLFSFGKKSDLVQSRSFAFIPNEMVSPSYGDDE